MLPGGCVVSAFECHCSCHTTGAVHVIPCCTECDFCGKNIVGDINGHKMKEHPETYKIEQVLRKEFNAERIPNKEGKRRA